MTPNLTIWVEVLTGIATLFFAVFVWSVTLLAKLIRRVTQAEDKVNNIAVDVLDVIKNEDNVHAAILEQMKFDRDATDKRLRFMEEYWMNSGLSAGKR